MEFVKQAFDVTKTWISGAPPPSALCAYVPPAVCNYVAAHPYITAVQASLAVPVILPQLVSVPVLGLVGFKAAGVAASSSAAAYQSVHGATWLFSILQSAGAGGYGVPVAKGIVAGMGSAGAVVAECLKWE